MASCKESLIVAAFDIGTTYSGYAYSTNNDPRNVCTNQIWIAGGRALVSLKTPTCVLLDPHGKFHSFGYEAENHYASLAEDENHHEWYYFRRFKMMLQEDKELARETMLEEINGKNMEALKIFSYSIEYLKDHLMRTLHNRLPDVTEDDIQFVLTVPAIWNDRAKQFMRDAANKAGIGNNKLVIALEPEAASIWCQGIETEVQRSSKGASANISAAGTQYMIVDIGGGTADITVHEKQRDKSLKEIAPPSGGPWGGTEVDNSFLEFLASVVSDEVMDTFKEHQMADYLDILREFETKKRSIETTSSRKILIKIPASLKEIFEEHGKTMASVKELFGDKVDWKGDKMRIDAEIIKNMFSMPVQKLVYHVRSILASRQMRNVRSIILVGGFAESPYVQDTIKESFGEKTIVIPQDCGLVVLKGAVVFGHKPSSISSRIARYTYGLELAVPFDKSIHPEEYRLEHKDGDFCDFGFWKAVVVGTSISPGQRVSRIGRPFEDYQDHVKYGIFRSTRPNTILVIEEDCEKIGDVCMELDSSKPSKDNTYDQTFVFGDTEIKFCTTNHVTGEEMQVYLEY
ncbi:HS12B-like protein [Mya arenaria]|uniref:HS12B-like protein n=1 Tax=Mya arenaria TaxID=6604 RepID=A0ABY7EI91_MYAAR|nr:heat shock 70 kDa protein 12A-like [Mya arenaria]WAR08521.1 HS12B-like protein [Mya arenaria]